MISDDNDVIVILEVLSMDLKKMARIIGRFLSSKGS
jgi:hypothetical protein